MNDFTIKLEEKRLLVEDYLTEQFTQETPYGILLEAMRYSLLAGGKRLRPVLLLAFCEACGGMAERALPAAAAVEMIHTYSLIHDDLPCMDNDDYRRGRLTCHMVYGEDIATLAGDALLTAAFRYVTQAEGTPEQVLRCVSILSQAAGEHGMVAGQILDLEGEQRTLSEAELRLVHQHKTGDMIRAACQIGTVLGGGTEQMIEAAGAFALHLGLAFQIRDDMLDCIGSQEELGKPIGSDQQNGKSTFVTLFGLDACQALVERETQAAIDCLTEGAFGDTAFIRALARELTARRK